MKKSIKKSLGGFFLVLCALVMMISVPTEATVVSSKAQIRAEMDRAFEDGDTQLELTIARTFSTSQSVAKAEAQSYAEELYELLSASALSHSRALSGFSYTYVIAGNRSSVTYEFDISPSYVKKVKIVRSEKAAYKQAVKALKNRDYTTAFYAENALYYDTFRLALQHHPEYNYDLRIWKSEDGTFGYKTGSMSKSQITDRMKLANAAADIIVERLIEEDMSNKEKLRILHDYLVRYCVYDEDVSTKGYDDAYTAYGCLVDDSAVCQGYAAAFNLLAKRAGVRSIAVSGSAGGASHAWNYIRDGKDYRYIDVTWDDPVPDRGSNGSVMQTYFYRTQSQLAKTHSWNKARHAKKYINYTR